MSSPTAIPELSPAPLAEALCAPPSPSSRKTFARYLLWLFLIPAMLYLIVIPLVRTPGYMRWWPSHWGPMLDFAWNSRGQDADVVIFGDSSAFLGVDPRIVNRQLGLKTLVLPNTVGSLPVMGDQALAAYLARNRRPQLIVLYFAPWNLNFGSGKETRLFEGEEILLRHGTAAEIAHFALQHPLELPAFPLRSYTSFGGSILKSIVIGRDRGKETALSLGHVDDRENYPAAQKDCTLPANLVNATGSASVQALAADYRRRGYQVAVYLAPIPECRNAEDLAGRTYGGLAATPPKLLDPAFFLQDGLYAHVEPGSVPITSQLFAQWLEKTLRP